MLRTFSLLAIALLTLLTGCPALSSGGTVLLDAPIIAAGDTKAPAIAVKDVAQGETAIPGEPFTVAVTDDQSTLGEVVILYNGQKMLDKSYNAHSIAIKYEVGSLIGTQTLQVNAKDAAGNASTYSISFPVIETRHAIHF